MCRESEAITATEYGDGLIVLEGDRRRAPLGTGRFPIRRPAGEGLGQVAALHAQGSIAHRRCNASHVLIDGGGEPVLIDWRVARSAPTNACWPPTWPRWSRAWHCWSVPSRRCRRRPPRRRLALALTLVQPAGLDAGGPGGGEEGQGLPRRGPWRAAEAAGVEYELAEVTRISAGRLVGVFGFVLLFYVALAFASNAEAIGEALGDADWTYIPIILVLAGLTYVGGAISSRGSPSRYPWGRRPR